MVKILFFFYLLRLKIVSFEFLNRCILSFKFDFEKEYQLKLLLDSVTIMSLSLRRFATLS